MNDQNNKNMLTQSDHDLLIRVDTRLQDLINSVKNLGDGMKKTVDDHELRLKYLEGYRGALVANIALQWGAWGIILTILIYHIFK